MVLVKRVFSSRDRADEVHAKVALDSFKTTGRRRAVTRSGYAGVVDENVQPPEIGLNFAGSGVNVSRIVEINPNVADVEIRTGEPGSHFFTPSWAAGAEQDGASRCSQPARNLVADAR